MEKVLAGKVAIVTGGSRGIGRAISIQLGRMGAKVVVNYVQSSNEAKEVVNIINDSGSEGAKVRADMCRVDEIRELFASTLNRFGRLDINPCID